MNLDINCSLKFFKKGKTRDIYSLDDKLVIVASDRISCFDVILPTPIPDKGKILTQMSIFWFNYLKDIIPSHFISSDINQLPEEFKNKEDLKGRFIIAKKCKVIPFECVVRGYLSGSAWKEYSKNQEVCGIKLPSHLKESDKLPEAIFTPATKAELGEHDENVTFEYLKNKLGQNTALFIKEKSIALYKKASHYAKEKGIIIADTKFEFGWDEEGKIILIDEVLTPDSSRFWLKSEYAPGCLQENLDKQFVRDWLRSINWNSNQPPPQLPQDIVQKTKNRYQKAYEMLVG